MINPRLLVLLFAVSGCLALEADRGGNKDDFESFRANWNGHSTYFDKNKDYNFYRIATYDQATGRLLVYYQGNVIENSSNQIDIIADGSAVWGPNSSDWVADNALVIKPMKLVHFTDRARPDPKTSTALTLLTMANDPVINAIMSGSPLAKIP